MGWMGVLYMICCAETKPSLFFWRRRWWDDDGALSVMITFPLNGVE